jgi:hypothetical protein
MNVTGWGKDMLRWNRSQAPLLNHGLQDGTVDFLAVPSSVDPSADDVKRMRQEIPLTDAEAAAVDDGAPALESLLKRLVNAPTPASPTPLQLSDCATARAKRRTDPLKQKSTKALRHVGGPFEMKGQNGAGSLASDGRTAASGLDAGACGSDSPRSSLRTTSARIDHEVIFAALAFLPLPFACS